MHVFWRLPIFSSFGRRVSDVERYEVTFQSSPLLCVSEKVQPKTSTVCTWAIVMIMSSDQCRQSCVRAMQAFVVSDEFVQSFC